MQSAKCIRSTSFLIDFMSSIGDLSLLYGLACNICIQMMLNIHRSSYARTQLVHLLELSLLYGFACNDIEYS